MKEVTPIEIYCFKKDEPVAPELREKLGLDTLFKDEKGKPYLPDSLNRYISKTHSRDYVLYGFADENIGIDLQYHTDARWRQISKRFFNEEESIFLSEFPDELGKKKFFQIWTAKESYVKYTGQGISDNFEKFSVLREDLGVSLTYVDFGDNYSLCVCSEKKRKILLYYR